MVLLDYWITCILTVMSSGVAAALMVVVGFAPRANDYGFHPVFRAALCLTLAVVFVVLGIAVLLINRADLRKKLAEAERMASSEPFRPL